MFHGPKRYPSRKRKSPATTGVEESSIRGSAASLILLNLNDNVVFEGDEQSPDSAQIVKPLLAVFRVTELSVGTPEGHDHGAAIHANPGLLGSYGFLKLCLLKSRIGLSISLSWSGFSSAGTFIAKRTTIFDPLAFAVLSSLPMGVVVFPLPMPTWIRSRKLFLFLPPPSSSRLILLSSKEIS